MLRCDFHMHTSFSGDCATPPELLVKRCLEAGLNCIAVTDHNTISGALEVRKLASALDNLTVIVGEEVKSSQGDIIGLFLEEEIPRGMSPTETARAIKDQKGLVVVPHPIDTIRRGPLSKAAFKEIKPGIDLIEVLNARTILPGDVERCRRLALETSITPIAVSDAHTLGELGSAFLEVDGFDGSALSLTEAAKGGRIVGRRSTPLVHVVTAYVKARRAGRRLSGQVFKFSK